MSDGQGGAGKWLRVALRVRSEVAGAPVRWDLDLDRLLPDGSAVSRWVDPDSWSLTHDGVALPFRLDVDTIDGCRATLRFRAPVTGEYEVQVAGRVRFGMRPAPARPPARPVPLVGAGDAIGFGLTDAIGDLHVGLQTAVEVVDWYGRGELDLLVTCHGHEGGAFLYAAVPSDPEPARQGDRRGSESRAGGRPVYRRVGRLPGFGDDGQSYNGRVRAVDFRGDGCFDLLECRGNRLLIHRNTGVRGAPAFGAPVPLIAGGEPLDLGVRLQSVCAVDLGDSRVSLIVGTNDWSDYWPKDVGAWEDRPGYRPYEADGTWRGGPLRGRLYLLRNIAPSGAPGSTSPSSVSSGPQTRPPDTPRAVQPSHPLSTPSRGGGTAAVDGPVFAAPVELCHEDGTPLEVYGLAGPAAIPSIDPAAGFDLLVSDFLDRIWYFRNTGRPGPDGVPRFTARQPVRVTGEVVPLIDRTPGPPPSPPEDYAPAGRLPDELVLPTCMHALVVVPWPNRTAGLTGTAGAAGTMGRASAAGAVSAVGAASLAGTVGTASAGDVGVTVDLLVGAEDGYVRALRWTGRTPDGVPIVGPPVRLQEYGAHLSAGAKACPNIVDWDGDGRDDLVIGNAAGQILLCRNQGTTAEPFYSPPEPVMAGDRPLWLMAGTPGTIQGPSEVKWGYINPAIGTWRAAGQDIQDGAGPLAIVCGDSLGNNTLYVAAGDDGRPLVSRGRRLHVLRDGRWVPLVTRWRCRPQLADWGDGEMVYVQVDEAGKIGRYRILPDGPDAEDGTPRVRLLDRLRYEDGALVQLDSDLGGRIGRLKLAVVDWDGDGLPDLLVGGSGTQPHGVNDLKKATIWLLRNVGSAGQPVLARPQVVPLDAGEIARFGSHSCVPAPCALDPWTGSRASEDSDEGPFDRLGAGSTKDESLSPFVPSLRSGQALRPSSVGQLPDLLVGSENGRVYAFRRTYIEAGARVTGERLLG